MTSPLTALVAVVATGTAAQWIAWRVHLPSILLLLLAGFILGPGTGFIDPDSLAGNLLMPAVSLAVALILFEGGLSLRFSEVSTTSTVVRRLVTYGAVIALGLTAVAARWCLGWDWALAFLLGAILVVTGPTVIGPLMRHVRPSREVAAVLKWEGIVIDPIGAMLALVVFQVVTADGGAGVTAPGDLAWIIARVVGIGVAAGAASAALLYTLFRRYWLPDYLHNPVTLAVVFSAFAASDHLQHESGLFAVTVMGLILANQKQVKTSHILEFNENLRVVFIAVLFVILAARIERDQLLDIPWAGASVLLAVLVLVIRPVSVALCTVGSTLDLNQRAFIAGVAPRGIIAAAVASVFAHRLAEAGFPGATQFVPLVFFLIVGTVAIYGLGASPLARALRIASANPQGCLIAGAHPAARAVASALRAAEFKVVLIDTNRANVTAARLAGFTAHHGSVASSLAEETLDLEGLGKLLALTSNSEVNSLACLQFKQHFGTEHIYHLAPEREADRPDSDAVAPEFSGRNLFRSPVSFSSLESFFHLGGTPKVTPLTEEFTFADYLAQGDPDRLLIGTAASDGVLHIFATDSTYTPVPGDRVLSLRSPDESSTAADG